MFQRAYVEITNVCNLRCSFCPGTAREKKFLDPADFRVLAEKLRPWTDYLYLHVMGEPLLHPALGEILDECDRLGFRVCVTTNGVLLPSRLAVLRGQRCLHKVSVSLHSFEGNGGEGGLEDYITGSWESCRALAAEGVICALRLWNGHGADRLNGQVLDILSRLAGVRAEDLPADRKGNRRLAERVFLEPGEKFDWPGQDSGGPEAQFCYGLRQQIAVLCDGTVVPCCLDGEGRLALGNLLAQELDGILDSPRARAIRDGFDRRRPSEALCRRCGFARRFNKEGSVPRPGAGHGCPRQCEHWRGRTGA